MPRVAPGVLETRASFQLLVSAHKSELLPTLDRPTNATSASESGKRSCAVSARRNSAACRGSLTGQAPFGLIRHDGLFVDPLLFVPGGAWPRRFSGGRTFCGAVSCG